jgi:hypothetical protein
MTKYWQIAAGSEGRDYTTDFLRYGMAFVGGDRQCEAMAKVEIGDVVLLKRGLTELVAAGRVVAREGKHRGDGDKPFLSDFDGWNLKAWCYVDWCVPGRSVAVTGFTRNTIQQVWIAELIEAAESVLAGAIAEFQPEPSPCQAIDDEKIVEFLIGKGLRIADAEDLTVTFRRIRRLANYYYEHEAGWEHIREHETRTFLIVPLLLALGWPEQSIKIEQPVPGGRVDLALFDAPFDGNSETAVALIETKGFTQGLSYAPGQAKGYTASFPDCKVIFVSNGYCYKAYERGAQGFPDVPSAYLNIRSPSDRYPIEPSIPGALRVLELLLRRSK